MRVLILAGLFYPYLNPNGRNTSRSSMIRSFAALRDVDPGFPSPRRFSSARVFAPPAVLDDPREYTRMHRAILERIAALPGVEAAGFASHLPMAGREETGGGPVEVEGLALGAAETPAERRFKFVAPGYWRDHRDPACV